MKVKKFNLIGSLAAMILVMTLALAPEMSAENGRSKAKGKKVSTWSILATAPKPQGRDFEAEFEDRHFYLFERGVCTRVPRESILHLPEQFQGRVLEKPKGNQIGWLNFLRQNRSWLGHHAVTWETVLGENPIRPEVRKGFAQNNRLVIASFQQGPVTVLPSSSSKSEVAKK